jgi:RNA polymerase sigma-70 factor (ECF subfamily)
MPNQEAILLERYKRYGDAEAFSEIVRQYAAMVFGTCQRILGDREQAADAVQETFFQLVKHAGQVQESLISWLHRVATHKAIDRIRYDCNRRRHEKEYCEAKLYQANQWQDVSPYVDEAIDELDESLRRILTRHYLQGQSMGRIAEEESVSQATISRRVESALDQLRTILERRGILVAMAGMGTMLVNSFVEAAPAAVLEELGKMAMVGGTTAVSGSVAGVVSAEAVTASGSTVGAAASLGVSSKLIAAAIVAALSTAGYVVYHKHIVDASHSPTALLLSDSDMTPARSPSPAADTARVSSASTLPQDEDFSNWLESTSMEIPVTTDGSGVEIPHSGSVDKPGQGDVLSGGAAIGGAAMGFGGGMMGAYGANVSFNTPNETVTSFVSLLENGQIEQLTDCFVEGAEDAVQLQQILQYPTNQGELEFNQCLKSIGSPVDVTRQVQGAKGLEVTWLCTVKEPFTMGGGGTSFMPGDRFELDATLVQIDGEWKMSGM